MKPNQLQAGDKVKVVDNTEFPCPFCKRRVMYGKMADSEYSAVSHDFPMCPTFVHNDGATFVRMCLTEINNRIN